MKITRTSPITGETRTMDLDVTTAQYIAVVNGADPAVVMPHLSVDERDFILTGITPDEYLAVFDDDELFDEWQLGSNESFA